IYASANWTDALHQSSVQLHQSSGQSPEKAAPSRTWALPTQSAQGVLGHLAVGTDYEAATGIHIYLVAPAIDHRHVGGAAILDIDKGQPVREYLFQPGQIGHGPVGQVVHRACSGFFLLDVVIAPGQTLERIER